MPSSWVIFLTQGLNLCLLHCKQFLYHLSHKGSLRVRDNGKRKLSGTQVHFCHKVAIRDLLHSQLTVLSWCKKRNNTLSPEKSILWFFTSANRPSVWRGYIFHLLWNNSECGVNGGYRLIFVCRHVGRHPGARKRAIISFYHLKTRWTYFGS